MYNFHFNNTPLGLNIKIHKHVHCCKCNEVEETHGTLLLALLNARCTNWSVVQFNNDGIEL